ncbi:MAG: hypothetical protein SGPRY_007470 [Prymnesium sp.]
MLPNFLTRLLLALMVLVMRLYVYPTAKLVGYKAFEPERDTIFVTCCTNGLGHVHQMERVLSVLREEGLKFPVVALAKEQKVPRYKLEALKGKFPETSFVNLNFEVDYDNGKSFKNHHVVWSATKQVFTASPFRKDAAVSPNASAAHSQRGTQGHSRAPIRARVRGRYSTGTSSHTSLPPALLSATGVVVKLPPMPEPDAEVEDFYVAYSTVPQVYSMVGITVCALLRCSNSLSRRVPQTLSLQVLSPIVRKLPNKRVLLFVKERRLAFYTDQYQKYPNIEVRETSTDFADYLARSKGLIASPSRGVVTQVATFLSRNLPRLRLNLGAAVALGKPVYLFCPKGHLEQEYNLRFYLEARSSQARSKLLPSLTRHMARLQNFAGVSSPRSRRYRRYVQANRAGELGEGWKGRLQTLAEWANATEGIDLRQQVADIGYWWYHEGWNVVDPPSAEELAREAAAVAAEEEEERREAAKAAKELLTSDETNFEPEDPEEGEEDPDELDTRQAAYEYVRLLAPSRFPVDGHNGSQPTRE